MALYFRPIMIMVIAVALIIILVAGVVFVFLGGLFIHRSEEWNDAFDAECCFTGVVAAKKCDLGVCGDGGVTDRCFGYERYYLFNISLHESTDKTLLQCANKSLTLPGGYDYDAASPTEIDRIFLQPGENPTPPPIHSWLYQSCDADNLTLPSICPHSCKVSKSCQSVSLADPEEDQKIGIILLCIGGFGIIFYCCFCFCFLIFRTRLRSARRAVKKNAKRVSSAAIGGVSSAAIVVKRKVRRKKKKQGPAGSVMGTTTYMTAESGETGQYIDSPRSPISPRCMRDSQAQATEAEQVNASTATTPTLANGHHPGPLRSCSPSPGGGGMDSLNNTRTLPVGMSQTPTHGPADRTEHDADTDDGVSTDGSFEKGGLGCSGAEDGDGGGEGAVLGVVVDSGDAANTPRGVEVVVGEEGQGVVFAEEEAEEGEGAPRMRSAESGSADADAAPGLDSPTAPFGHSAGDTPGAGSDESRRAGSWVSRTSSLPYGE